MARPTLAEIALRIGPIRSRSSAGVVEPDHWKHPAGLAWWYRDVPSMCASISPPYHTSSAGDFSRITPPRRRGAPGGESLIA